MQELEEEVAEEQQENTKKERYAHLKEWQFKPGVSGNPNGRPKGAISLKQWAKNYIQTLSDEERLEFLAGMDKRTIWEMAEGKPKQENELTGNLTISQVLDQLDNDGQPPEEQTVET